MSFDTWIYFVLISTSFCFFNQSCSWYNGFFILCRKSSAIAGGKTMFLCCTWFL